MTLKNRIIHAFQVITDKMRETADAPPAATHPKQQRLIEMVNFLKKTTIKKDGQLKNLHASPWFLMIGPSQSGKTTLLAKSDIKFNLEKKIKDKNNIAPTKHPDFWVTQNAVLIDTPGKLFDTATHKKSIFKHKTFLSFLKKHCHQKALKGIILVLDISKIMQQKPDKLQSFYKNIQRQLQDIEHFFSHQTPVFILLNKCDLITGFREFFGDLGQEERWQTWGMSFDANESTQLIQQFEKKFDDIIVRLNDQTIWKLQHENNADKRALINDFPMQLLHAKTVLANVIIQIAKELKNLDILSGLFFTSGTQQSLTPETAEFIDASASTALINIRQPKNYALFVHDFFHHHLNASTTKETLPETVPPQIQQKKIFAYLIAGFIILVPLVIWIFNFKAQVQNINLAQQSLTVYQTLMQSDFSHANLKVQLQSLNVLHTANQQLTERQQNLFSHLSLLNSPKTLQNTLLKTYRHALDQILLPIAAKDLTEILTNAKTSPELLYAALKTYLMLGHAATPYNPNDIFNLMKKIWQTRRPKHMQTTLLAHLYQLLQTNDFLPITIDNAIVTQAQSILKNMKTIDLAEVILYNSIPNNQSFLININDNPIAAKIFNFANKNATIDSMYTNQYFAMIFPTFIQQVASAVVQGNDVIGISANHLHISEQTNLIATELAKRYLTNYANLWINFLNNLKINRFNRLPDLINALNLLSDDQALILQVLNITNNNIPPIVIAQNTTLKALNDIMRTNSLNPPSAQDLVITLRNLSQYLSMMTTSNNPHQKIFEMTQLRMRNQGKDDAIDQILQKAKRYPEPIRSWLYQLGQNAWQLMLTDSQQYMNQTWRAHIAPQFDAQLAGQFPFNKNATHDAKLANFANFFAPNGLFSQFFNRYLKTFINTERIPWKLKNVDGETLSLSNDTLKTLQKAYLIQRTYFPDATPQLLIPFSLALSRLDLNDKSVTVTLGGQQLTFRKADQATREEFFWPDDVNTNVANIVLTDKNNRLLALQQTGPWAWLKLLRNHIQKTSAKSRTYRVAFKKGKKHADFLLTLKHPKNPFDLNLLADFHVPDSLFE